MDVTFPAGCDRKETGGRHLERGGLALFDLSSAGWKGAAAAGRIGLPGREEEPRADRVRLSPAGPGSRSRSCSRDLRLGGSGNHRWCAASGSMRSTGRRPRPVTKVRRPAESAAGRGLDTACAPPRRGLAATTGRCRCRCRRPQLRRDTDPEAGERRRAAPALAAQRAAKRETRGRHRGRTSKTGRRATGGTTRGGQGRQGHKAQGRQAPHRYRRRASAGGRRGENAAEAARTEHVTAHPPPRTTGRRRESGGI